MASARPLLGRLAACGEEMDACERHAGCFLALADEARPHVDGAEPAPWLDRLEAEHDNLRAALGWLLERPARAPAGRLAAALWPF